MKFIRKRTQPRDLYRWHLDNAKVPDAQYGTHGFPTKVVHSSLVEEQGAICAYTMLRIDLASSHIEHLKPQAVSKADKCLEETFDYANLVACYPRAHLAGDPPVTFGAIYRGNRWDEKQFITPLTQACEARLRFHLDGEVRPRRANDGAAAWTIKALNLGDQKLVEMRLAAIEARGLSLAADSPLTRDEAAKLAKAIERRNGDDSFEAFCVAIRHAAEEYISLLDKMASRRQHARPKRNGRRRR